MNLGTQKIIDRISDIFSIFDFSYLVAGTATYLIICYGLWQYHLLQWSGNHIINGLISLILSYLCGLLSFAAGKLLRMGYIRFWLQEDVNARFFKCFNDAILYCRDADHPLMVYRTITDCKLYYTHMWAFLRHSHKAAATFSFINRYWVMQAVYEGLATSFLIGCILGVILCMTQITIIHIFILLFSVIAFFFCCHEGTRYAETQISEVVIAYKTFKFQ